VRREFYLRLDAIDNNPLHGEGEDGAPGGGALSESNVRARSAARPAARGPSAPGAGLGAARAPE
jgi:hypothetical protein